MRNLTFSVNGTVVKTYAEALELAGGKTTLIKEILTEVPAPPLKMSEKRKALRVKAVKA